MIKPCTLPSAKLRITSVITNPIQMKRSTLEPRGSYWYDVPQFAACYPVHPTARKNTVRYIAKAHGISNCKQERTRYVANCIRYIHGTSQRGSTHQHPTQKHRTNRLKVPIGWHKQAIAYQLTFTWNVTFHTITIVAPYNNCKLQRTYNTIIPLHITYQYQVLRRWN